MGLFKPDFFRSLAIGFAVGAVLVFSMIDSGAGSSLANGVAPRVEARAAQ